MAFIVELTRDIDAPAELVWEVITDLPRYPEWNPFCVECDSTLRPGDPIDMKVNFVGRPQRQREWMSDYVEGTSFAYTMKPIPLGALSSRRSHDVGALDTEHTRYRSYFRLEGWLYPVVWVLFRTTLEAGFTNMTTAVQRRAQQLWTERNQPTPR